MTAKPAAELPRREQILAAAVEVFSEKGFHSARVEEIAHRAGIGKGTVYEYFTTKKELFQEVLREGMDYYRQEIQREQASTDPLAARLKRIASVQLSFAARHSNMAKVLMNDPETVSQTAKEIYLAIRTGVHADLVQLFQEAARREEIPAGDFTAAAWMMLGALNALATTAILTDEDFVPQAWADTFVDIFLNGLTNM
jgi:AcrR family transcriptional regulator